MYAVTIAAAIIIEKAEIRSGGKINFIFNFLNLKLKL
jgi:hypothetical protein